MIQFLLYWVVSGCLWLMISRPVNVKCSTKTKCLTKSRPNIQPRLQVGVTPNMGYSVCLFWWVLCMDWLSWRCIFWPNAISIIIIIIIIIIILLLLSCMEFETIYLHLFQLTFLNQSRLEIFLLHGGTLVGWTVSFF